MIKEINNPNFWVNTENGLINFDLVSKYSVNRKAYKAWFEENYPEATVYNKYIFGVMHTEATTQDIILDRYRGNGIYNTTEGLNTLYELLYVEGVILYYRDILTERNFFLSCMKTYLTYVYPHNAPSNFILNHNIFCDIIDKAWKMIQNQIIDNNTALYIPTPASYLKSVKQPDGSYKKVKYHISYKKDMCNNLRWFESFINNDMTASENLDRFKEETNYGKTVFYNMVKELRSKVNYPLFVEKPVYKKEYLWSLTFTDKDWFMTTEKIFDKIQSLDNTEYIIPDDKKIKDKIKNMRASINKKRREEGLEPLNVESMKRIPDLNELNNIGVDFNNMKSDTVIKPGDSLDDIYRKKCLSGKKVEMSDNELFDLNIKDKKITIDKIGMAGTRAEDLFPEFKTFRK